MCHMPKMLLSFVPTSRLTSTRPSMQHHSMPILWKLRKILCDTFEPRIPLEHNACHQLLYLTEIIEDSHSLELLHFAMQAPQRHSRPQLLERLIHELDLFTCGEEDNDLGAQVGLDEGPQHIHLLMQLTNDISLQHSTESVLSTAQLRDKSHILTYGVIAQVCMCMHEYADERNILHCMILPGIFKLSTAANTA